MDAVILRPRGREDFVRGLPRAQSGHLRPQTSSTISYAKTPKRYRAIKFSGAEGDSIEAWVRSSNGGDAVAWVLDNDFKILAMNDDADKTTLDAHIRLTLPANPSATHYVVLRDYALRSAKFTVKLQGSKPSRPRSSCRDSLSRIRSTAFSPKIVGRTETRKSTSRVP